DVTLLLQWASDVYRQFILSQPATASMVASIGATFTGVGSGTSLTVSAITGVLHPGDSISGTGIPNGTTIVSQSSGTTGSNGVYVTSAATTVNGPVTSASKTMEVTAVASGSLAINQFIYGAPIAAGTYIVNLGTGGGGPGTYILSTAQTVSS